MDTTQTSPENLNLKAGNPTVPFWRICHQPPLQCIVLRPVKNNGGNKKIANPHGVLRVAHAESARILLFPVGKFLGVGENERAIQCDELEKRFASRKTFSLEQIIKCCADNSPFVIGRTVVFLSRICLPEIPNEKIAVMESGLIYLAPPHFLFTEASWVAVSS